LWEKLEVGDGLRAVPHRRANAIVTCVTAPDDDYIFALGVDVVPILQFGVQKRLRVHLPQKKLVDDIVWLSDCANLKELHGKVDPVDVPIGDLQVAGPGRASADHDRVVFAPKLRNFEVDADVRVRDKSLEPVNGIQSKAVRETTYNALISHQIETTLDYSLLQLHAKRGESVKRLEHTQRNSAYLGIPYIKSPPMRSLRS
jgi:hypothetical protein